MRRFHASSPASRAPGLLFALAVVLLPVTGLTGIDALGELKGSASVYVFLLTILAFALWTGLSSVEIPRSVLVFVAALVAWLAIDTALNYETIGTASFEGRTGVSKLVTASMVLGFGFTLVIVSVRLLREPRDLHALFMKPLTIAVLVCTAFAVPELITWVSPSATGLYDSTTALFHTVESEKGRVIGRLTSITFEAPDLAYFSGLTLPWLLLSCRLSWRHPQRRGGRLAVLALLVGLGLIALSNSRTGFLMIAVFIVSEITFWFGLRRLQIPAVAVATMLAIGLLGYVGILSAQLPGVGDTAVSNEDVSTITRSALLTAQLAMFSEHPIGGVGFGQYGFHVPNLLPPWAWSSYEIERFFETGGEMPPSFNVFGRIGSELGIPGLLIWFGFWIGAVHRIARVVPHLPSQSFAIYVNATLLSSTVCLLVGGISTDAFRRPETWVLVAVTGLYAGSGSRRTRVLAL